MTHHDLNRIVLTGCIHAEPEMWYTANGEPHTMLMLASVRPGVPDAEQVDLFRLLARGDPLAEVCNELLPHARVLVEGAVQCTTAATADERIRFPYEVLIHQLIALDPPPDRPGATAPLPRPRHPTPSAAASAIAPPPRSITPLSAPGIPRPARLVHTNALPTREGNAVTPSVARSFELADLPL